MALGDSDLQKTPATTKLDTSTQTTTTATSPALAPNTTMSTLDSKQAEKSSTSGTPGRVAYMAGNDDFRAARLRAAVACEEYNCLSENATPEERILHWTK